MKGKSDREVEGKIQLKQSIYLPSAEQSVPYCLQADGGL